MTEVIGVGGKGSLRFYEDWEEAEVTQDWLVAGNAFLLRIHLVSPNSVEFLSWNCLLHH